MTYCSVLPRDIVMHDASVDVQRITLNASKFGALLWRHLTPQRKKIAIQLNNYNPPDAQMLQKYLGKFTPVRPLGLTKLFVPSRFWITCTNFDKVFCCQRYIAS